MTLRDDQHAHIVTEGRLALQRLVHAIDALWRFRPPAEGGLIYVRVYIYDEDRMLHLGAELDVKAVRQEAIAVEAAFGRKYGPLPA